MLIQIKKGGESMENEKIKTLIDSILAQCEEQGLTEAEVKKIPNMLRNEITGILTKKKKITLFHR